MADQDPAARPRWTYWLSPVCDIPVAVQLGLNSLRRQPAVASLRRACSAGAGAARGRAGGHAAVGIASPACAPPRVHTAAGGLARRAGPLHPRRCPGRRPAGGAAFFVALLERTAGLNRQWAARAVARTPSLRDAAEQICDDLHQELTLRLWEHIALQSGEQWELFFRRALDFAQRHTATAYMERHGYWSAPGIAQPARVRTLILSMLGRGGDDGAPADGALLLADGGDHFSRAELADLRGLVLRLPAPERTVVVMRYWHHAGESDIAAALGVTTRTVRNHHRRARARLKEWYVGKEGAP